MFNLEVVHLGQRVSGEGGVFPPVRRVMAGGNSNFGEARQWPGPGF